MDRRDFGKTVVLGTAATALAARHALAQTTSQSVMPGLKVIKNTKNH